MSIFDSFKKKSTDQKYDFSKILNDNDAKELLDSGILKRVLIVSSIFGGSEELYNQTIITAKAEEEKVAIDKELSNFLEQGKSVKNLKINFKYKKKSAIPSKYILSATVDGKAYKKVIDIW